MKWLCVSGLMAGAALVAACSSRTVLTDLVEARRLAASMHVAFATAAETSSRAVMGRSDDESRAAAIEAVKARDAVERDLAALRPLLQRLRYAEEVRLLETFMAQFADYKRLDDELLPLAAENSNLRAQQLSFGAARDAAAAVRQAVGDSPAAARAYIGTLEILALQAPHIAEATDEAMTRMEAEMARSEATVRQALAQLKSGVPASQVNAATAAFDRFMSINAEILTLSRRNSNVRSLALALGQRRETTALCEATLQALERTLAAHSLGGTR